MLKKLSSFLSINFSPMDKVWTNYCYDLFKKNRFLWLKNFFLIVYLIYFVNLFFFNFLDLQSTICLNDFISITTIIIANFKFDLFLFKKINQKFLKFILVLFLTLAFLYLLISFTQLVLRQDLCFILVWQESQKYLKFLSYFICLS